MEMTATPLTRTYTAPASSHTRLANSTSSSTRNHHQSHPDSSYSNFSHPSRASDSTQDTSQSTLFSPQAALTNNQINSGPVGPSNNVINRVADKETSLFQICVNLRNRLRGVPGFEEQLQEIEEQSEREDTDPVTLLWRTFRRGYPLLTIYNALEPEVPLVIDDNKFSDTKNVKAVERRQKAAAFMFLKACLNQLRFPTEECFIISDLYGEDTSGFVKVASVVNRVVDILVQEGYLVTSDGDNVLQEYGPTAKRTQRQHIIDELVSTERTYVQHLEILQSFKKQVENKGIIPGDAIHDIFLNLNPLLDFQRRFLIRVEQINRQPEEEQNWGKIFTLYRSGFGVYELYIANQKKCEETAMREFDKLRAAGGSIEMRQIVESATHLTAFLLKPFQRLSKYPLLLRELRDKGELDEERRNDISEAIEVVTSVLERTNAEIAKEERSEALASLKNQVEDWKNHRVEDFGSLLLYGKFNVTKGEVVRDAEREYQMYLFEVILLCCKEANPYKQKNRIMNRPQPPSDKNTKPRLQLKGRIFMQNVTDTVFLSKPGSYTCQINWRGDDVIEYFIIKFPTEEIMKKWRGAIERQRRICSQQPFMSSTTSETEFNYIRDQGALQNPYEDDDALDDEESGYHLRYSGDSGLAMGRNMSRNESSTSLRSRSTTGESGPPVNMSNTRAFPHRYQTATAGVPLALRTQIPSGVLPPTDKGGPSYFSPSVESPMSARTSGSSGIYSFPRHTTPQQGGWNGEDQTRFTAPPGGRFVMQDANGYYQVDNRNPRGPNGNVQAPQQTTATQTRLRSASTNDIQHSTNASRRTPNNAPPVPNLPSHLLQHPTESNRSQSNSPIHTNGLPFRSNAQSPSSRRQGPQIAHQSQQSYDGPNYHNQPGLASKPQVASFSSETGSLAPTSSVLSLNGGFSTPSQLKVKVRVPSEGSSMTLVVGFNISFQSLVDRIDAKLLRHSKLSVASGSVKLKYFDDDEYVSIQTDEDVQTAFETWKDQKRDYIAAGQLGEVELLCLRPAD